jgi:hypothetical protein
LVYREREGEGEREKERERERGGGERGGKGESSEWEQGGNMRAQKRRYCHF